MVAAPEVPTVGSIAKKYKVATHKVEYIIRRWSLLPVGKAGHTSIYSEDDSDFIGEMLKRIASEREGSDAT
jgi:hypothetical protein